ncbi:ORF230 [White spot syndrome virus]|uniref:ORF230 n=1 Tax=White spot syndrome virus TaxID=342409 RepID=A0A2D3I624_9VIRU|nr:ORF230 [White spot syndrome virus]
MFLKNFLKIFLDHSSLGGGPLSRPDVKFRGWTAGSTQCQIAPEPTVAPEMCINLCVFLEQTFLGIAAPRKGRCNILFSL